MNLKGRVAVVTGSGTGIGQATAIELAGRGAKVVVNHWGVADGAFATAQQIAEAGGEAMIVEADVSDHEEVHRMMRAAAGRWGRLDILVNNAAVQYNIGLLDYAGELFDRLINTNLRGYWSCIHAAVPYMRERNFGRVICISSVHEKRPTDFDAVYAMSKGGIMMLVREAALALGRYGITVNGVAPGAIRSAKADAGGGTAAAKAKAGTRAAYGRTVEQRFPVGRIGTPTDVARLVCWIASEESGYLSGSSIRLDGGSMLT